MLLNTCYLHFPLLLFLLQFPDQLKHQTFYFFQKREQLVFSVFTENSLGPTMDKEGTCTPPDARPASALPRSQPPGCIAARASSHKHKSGHVMSCFK